MHIGFQRSGGRGEYEVVGSHTGYTAISLEGWTFDLRWPDGIVRETGLGLEPGESGKPRLRSLRDQPYQIGRMVAAMLLLPVPRRELGETEASLPVERAKGYVLSRVGFGPGTEFDGITDRVTIEPSFINLTNQVETESIGVEKRWARIQAVYAASGVFDPKVRDLLDRHHTILDGGDPITNELTTLVGQLAQAMERVYPGYSKSDDPLPELERRAGIVPSDGPSLPSPDDLGEDEPEVSARSAYQYRLAKVRGPEHQKFSLAVRAAYGHRCAFCGGRYGGVAGVRSGLEAAHILAWSKYDADVLLNGMSLCKTHHWAFDAALLVPEYSSGSYRLRFTTLSESFEPESMALLGEDRFVIPDAWLPAKAGDRPSRKHLDKLYEDLAISFVD